MAFNKLRNYIKIQIEIRISKKPIKTLNIKNKIIYDVTFLLTYSHFS